MSGSASLDIRDQTHDGIEEFFLQHGEKKFRAAQVDEWLWKKSCHSFDAMTNLSRKIRQLLKDHFSFHTAVAETLQQSSDGTIKTGFILHDGLWVESVLIPSGNRSTVCVSSQVGCALGCKFCATGQLGFSRNLTVGEIFDQVTAPPPAPPQPGRGGATLRDQVSNIVFMGMGEPFLNYENVVSAIEKITSTEGLGMSPQRITVSSVGIPRMI